MHTLKTMLLAAGGAGRRHGLPPQSAHAESVVRYGISMADIPLTTGQPDRGAGAYQFTAYTIYDPLVAWEMDVSDRPGKLVPGSPPNGRSTTRTRPNGALRCARASNSMTAANSNADAVIWNLGQGAERQGTAVRQAPERAGQDPPALGRQLRQDRRRHRRDHDKKMDSFFPYQMLWFLVSSPAQYEKLGKDWDKFASQPPAPARSS